MLTCIYSLLLREFAIHLQSSLLVQLGQCLCESMYSCWSVWLTLCVCVCVCVFSSRDTESGFTMSKFRHVECGRAHLPSVSHMTITWYQLCHTLYGDPHPHRLSGISPFFADNIQAIVERIQEARYSFYHTQFEQVSQEAKEFISALLQKSPE